MYVRYVTSPLTTVTRLHLKDALVLLHDDLTYYTNEGWVLQSGGINYYNKTDDFPKSYPRELVINYLEGADIGESFTLVRDVEGFSHVSPIAGYREKEHLSQETDQLFLDEVVKEVLHNKELVWLEASITLASPPTGRLIMIDIFEVRKG